MTIIPATLFTLAAATSVAVIANEMRRAFHQASAVRELAARMRSDEGFTVTVTLR